MERVEAARPAASRWPMPRRRWRCTVSAMLPDPLSRPESRVWLAGFRRSDRPHCAAFPENSAGAMGAVPLDGGIDHIPCRRGAGYQPAAMAGDRLAGPTNSPPATGTREGRAQPVCSSSAAQTVDLFLSRVADIAPLMFRRGAPVSLMPSRRSINPMQVLELRYLFRSPSTAIRCWSIRFCRRCRVPV